MKTIITVLCILVAASCVFIGIAYGAEVKREISPVVSIDGCTAFYIGDQKFLTAGHCYENELIATFSDGRKAIIKPLARGAADWALFVASNDFVTKDVTPMRLQCEYTPIVGTPVSMTGYPGPFGRFTQFGHVASADMTAFGESRWPAPLYRLNISSLGGFSGSPVVREETGRVIAILVGSATENKDIAFAQGLSQFCEVTSKYYSAAERAERYKR